MSKNSKSRPPATKESKAKSSDKQIAENRKARFNYQIVETFEGGLVLRGTEVKSCRLGKVNLSDGYAAFRGSELYLQNILINEYSHGNRANHEPKRTRKVLLHRKELNKLIGELNSGLTLVPLKMYIKNARVKVLLGLAKGKKDHDKREDLKKKQANREMQRAFIRTK